MKLPDIATKDKKLRIRNIRICMLWAQELKTSQEIGETFGITIRRVQQILYANRDFVKENREWEKTKRIQWLRQQVKKRGDTRKDSADLIEQLRKELEGDNSEHKVVIEHKHFFEGIIQKSKEYNRCLTN